MIYVTHEAEVSGGDEGVLQMTPSACNLNKLSLYTQGSGCTRGHRSREFWSGLTLFTYRRKVMGSRASAGAAAALPTILLKSATAALTAVSHAATCEGRTKG